jgi:hypothetical protein
MPKLLCPCGGVLNLSAIPDPNGFSLRSESDLDEIITRIVRLHERPEEGTDFQIAVIDTITPLKSPAPHVFQCTSCGRLAICPHPSMRESPIWFSPDNRDGPPPLLAALYDVVIPPRGKP